MIAGLQRAAVVRGALCVLYILVPTYAGLQLLSGGDPDSATWIIFVLALLFAAMFGGWAAARDRPARPLVHATAGAVCGLALALGAGLLLQLVQGDLGLAQIVTAVVFLYIGACLGLLGGLLAVKGVRP